MKLFYALCQQLLRVLFSATINVRSHGRENVPLTGPVLLVSNHQSYLDPVLCGLGLNRELDYMARESLFGNRYFRRLIESLNAFPVRRGQADVAAIKEIIHRLRAGRAVVVFPEATRTGDGLIKKIKPGFDLIARRSGGTTVPVVIEGAYEVWPRHKKLPGVGRIQVMYGRAITPQETKLMSREQFITCINERLRQMQNQLRRQYGKIPYEYETEEHIEK